MVFSGALGVWISRLSRKNQLALWYDVVLDSHSLCMHAVCLCSESGFKNKTVQPDEISIFIHSSTD
jgi:hypothetical protein